VKTDMQETAADYVVHLPEGGWRVFGSRVSLDSVVHGYWEGRSPEAIAEEFPSLSPERVYGAIAFYLRNRDEIDQYLAAQDENWRKLRESSEECHRPLLERLRASSRSTTSQE
jgi:uncharacterized protein (DUF433 family)